MQKKNWRVIGVSLALAGLMLPAAAQDTVFSDPDKQLAVNGQLKIPQKAIYLPVTQVKWMLQNPHGTKEQCEDHLRSLKRRWDDASSTANQDHDRDDRPFDEPLGMSDGTGKTPSSPITSKATVSHFSKKMHVESMDIS